MIDGAAAVVLHLKAGIQGDRVTTHVVTSASSSGKFDGVECRASGVIVDGIWVQRPRRE